MEWKKPQFEEINMSAEIGSYQEDDGGRYPLAKPAHPEFADETEAAERGVAGACG